MCQKLSAFCVLTHLSLTTALMVSTLYTSITNEEVETACGDAVSPGHTGRETRGWDCHPASPILEAAFSTTLPLLRSAVNLIFEERIEETLVGRPSSG